LQQGTCGQNRALAKYTENSGIWPTAHGPTAQVISQWAFTPQGGSLCADTNLLFFSHCFRNKQPKSFFILPNVLYLGTGGDMNLNQKLPGSGGGGLPRVRLFAARNLPITRQNFQ
jgi:hypothetical protein